MGKDRIKMRTYEHVASLGIHKTPSSFTRRLSRSLKTILQWWIINYLEIKYFFPMSSIDTSSLFLKNPWYRMLMKLINGYQPLAFTLTITATKITSENTMNKSSSGESKHKFTISLLSQLGWFRRKRWLLLSTKYSLGGFLLLVVFHFLGNFPRLNTPLVL